MRHLTARVVVAIFTFAVGVVIASIWLIYRAPAVDESAIKAPRSDANVPFCDLIQHPEQYNSKTIRVRSTLLGFHEMALYDPACDSEMHFIRAELDSKSRQELGRLTDGWGIRNGSFWVNAVVRGRFEKISDEEQRSEAEDLERIKHPGAVSNFRLAVSDIEQMEPVASNVPWPQ
jgi:hypothetical protein